MPRTVAMGIQDFESVRKRGVFYIDKTDFIREWWESEDEMTLITRPRRFGKTLNLSMIECFFSNKYRERPDLFEGLSIWNTEKYRKLQGTYPVIRFSFAGVKERIFKNAYIKICEIITKLYDSNQFLMEVNLLTDNEKNNLSQ